MRPRRSRTPGRQKTAEEDAHIRKIGQGVFAKAYDWANFATRADGHFVGLDRLRAAISFEAALRATGFADRALLLPRTAGTPQEETQRLAEDLLVRATEAARRHVVGRLV